MMLVACGGGSGGDTGGGQPPPVADKDTPAVIPVVANDIAWDPVTKRIYLSVSAATGPNGNVVMAIDPVTGATVASRYAGSEPNRLSVSDDGRYLYVGVDGESSIRRFVLPDLTPDIRISLGMNPYYGPNLALDLGVAPGAPRTLAVSLGNRDIAPLAQGGIVIYDDDIARPTIANKLGSNYYSMQWGDNSSELYAAETETTGYNFFQIAVDGSGAREIANFPGKFAPFYSTIHYDRGNRLLYGDFGAVVDPRTGEDAGGITDAQGLVAPDSSGNAIYYGVWTTLQGDMTVQVFDPKTRQLRETRTLRKVLGDRTHFIRWGDTGLAFTTTSGFAYLTDSNGPRQAELPVIPRKSATITVIPIVAGDIAWDNSRNLLYASIPASASSNPNSIAVIDASSGSVASVVAAGDNPGKLAISDDSKYLYVGLDGSASISRFSLPNLQFDLSIALGTPEFNPDHPYFPLEMQPLPDTPRSVAVLIGRKGLTPTGSGGVAIFDDAVRRPLQGGGFPDLTMPSCNSIQFGRNGTELFAANTEDSAQSLFRLSVTAAGASVVTKYNGIFRDLYGEIHFDHGSGILYADDGHTAAPDTGLPAGRFPFADAMIPDSATNKAYLVFQTASQQAGSDYTLAAYDLQHFTPVAQFVLPNMVGKPVRIMRLGTHGFALLTTASIYVITGNIVQ